MSGADRDGLRDAGLFDIGGARRCVRRVKLREDLRDLVRRATALLDVIDQDAETASDERTARLERAIGLNGSLEEHILDQVAVFPVQFNEEEEEQLLQGSDMVLQLLDRLAFALRHGAFSVAVDRQPTHDSEPAHRLSEPAK